MRNWIIKNRKFVLAMGAAVAAGAAALGYAIPEPLVNMWNWIMGVNGGV